MSFPWADGEFARQWTKKVLPDVCDPSKPIARQFLKEIQVSELKAAIRHRLKQHQRPLAQTGDYFHKTMILQQRWLFNSFVSAFRHSFLVAPS
jgi:hypothetical protein